MSSRNAILFDWGQAIRFTLVVGFMFEIGSQIAWTLCDLLKIFLSIPLG